ncbi:biotin transporter BioY [Streptococcus loxodontisalivarius]|uniref:Biotin transporter n=1 Tax=Streptococcus loxodontisalivarius TaxID=1349415 RepID=A0ABS2PR74_9STRE|nr:biotin transporter BioY [Streptococcus loxodontisalivarius]MBM7642381.1 biotin transport system substrate-specific component [Streptococcus loxodontisalivarius]
MKIKDMTQMTLWLAITIVLAYVPSIPIPFLPVPIVIQNMVFMMMGAFLGAKRGFLTALLYLFIYATGLLGRGGLAVFFSASGGYLFSYPFAVLLIGYFFKRYWSQMTWIKAFAWILLFGVIFINLCGALFMVYYLHLGNLVPILVSCLIYLPGDIVKAALAVLIFERLKLFSLLAK